MKLNVLAKKLGINCDSDNDVLGLATLEQANESQVSFFENIKYLEQLKNTKALAVFIMEKYLEYVPKSTIPLVSNEPYVSLAYASSYFAPPVVEKKEIQAIIGSNTTISENVYIGNGARIGDNCIVMPGVCIGDNVYIGNNCILYPNIVIYRDCIIGNDVKIHAGTIIGSDGFGFANTKDGKYIKIYQNGIVKIGDDIEIGANCTIDRAAFDATIIENGVRIDNLVHIAHNCIIGSGSILAGQVGLAGSVKLGNFVVMAGQSAAVGHLEIAPFSTISARSVVTKTIREPKKQWAGFPIMEHGIWLKLQAKIARLLKTK